MAAKDILFSDYLPDQGALPSPQDPGYLIRAENVRPTTEGYRPMPIAELIASAATIGATPVSAAGFAVSSTARHYAGTSTALYESNDQGVTWFDNSKAAYSASQFWDFDLFGNTVVAVNGTDVPQAKDITAAIANNFADLGGSPPAAGRVARIRDHLVLGRLTANQFAIQTSAIGNPADWPVVGSADALAKQSIFRELPRELGEITQIVGGEKGGLVFQLHGITRMTYVGGDVVYQLDVFERSRGTGFNNGAIRVGDLTYYASVLGIHRTDGYAVQNLSAGKVEESIIKNLTSYLDGIVSFGQSVAYDARSSTVMWPFLTSGNGYALLCYHIAADRFTVSRFVGATMLLGTLYSVRNAGNEEVSKAIPYAFNSTPKLNSFTLTSNNILLQTGYVELQPGYVTQVTGIQILGSAIGSPNLQTRATRLMSAIDTTTTGITGATAPNRSDIYRARKTGRFHNFYVIAAVDANAMYRGFRIHYERVTKL